MVLQGYFMGGTAGCTVGHGRASGQRPGAAGDAGVASVLNTKAACALAAATMSMISFTSHAGRTSGACANVIHSSRASKLAAA